MSQLVGTSNYYSFKNFVKNWTYQWAPMITSTQCSKCEAKSARAVTRAPIVKNLHINTAPIPNTEMSAFSGFEPLSALLYAAREPAIVASEVNTEKHWP